VFWLFFGQLIQIWEHSHCVAKQDRTNLEAHILKSSFSGSSEQQKVKGSNTQDPSQGKPLTGPILSLSVTALLMETAFLQSYCRLCDLQYMRICQC